MNWWTLRKYIATLQQAGFDVAGLSVQLQKKLSFPLIAPIIIVLAIPFSILVGTRGALAAWLWAWGWACCIGRWPLFSRLWEPSGNCRR